MYGNFQFSLKTLSANSLSRSTEYKWVDTDRVGDLPYVQNLGIAKDNVEIEGIFYPKLNAATQYNSIDKMAIGIAKEKVQDFALQQLGLSDILLSNDGNYQTIADIRNSDLCKTANNLIIDSGEILGKFVIIGITETQSFFDKNGVPQKVEFKLTLKRTPGVNEAFVGVDGANSLIDTITNLARSYLRW
ncbi:MAG: phage tail protein [Holosporaceae bacterium]|jgi:phage protein U|nr:phage tail protein [Holosporaceae bacterium]